MKKMIAVVTLVVGLNAPAMAKELAKEVDLTDIHAVNQIGVTYRLCLAAKTFNDGTTEYLLATLRKIQTWKICPSP